jgi:hypothetical protein
MTPVTRRDGKPSECIMYYCYGDKIKMEQMMAGDLHGDRCFRIRFDAKTISLRLSQEV